MTYLGSRPNNETDTKEANFILLQRFTAPTQPSQLSTTQEKQGGKKIPSFYLLPFRLQLQHTRPLGIK